MSDIDWSTVRAAFALDPAWIHLAASGPAPASEPARGAVERHRRALDSNPIVYVEAMRDELLDAARTAAAHWLGGVAPDAVGFECDPMTGIMRYANSLALDDRDEVVVFGSHAGELARAVRTLSDRTHAALYETTLDADRLDAAIGRRTRLIAASWVDDETGVRFPARELARVVAEINERRHGADRIHLVIDGTLGLLSDPTPVGALECDCFVADVNRAAYGPRGVCVSWTRAGRALAESVAPAPEHLWATLEAFEFVNAIGRERVSERTRVLAEQLRAGLAGIPSVRVCSTSCGEVATNVTCIETSAGEDLPRTLRDARIVVSRMDDSPSRARIGVHVYSIEADVDAALNVIRRLG